jgi:hypothetical protein
VSRTILRPDLHTINIYILQKCRSAKCLSSRWTVRSCTSQSNAIARYVATADGQRRVGRRRLRPVRRRPHGRPPPPRCLEVHGKDPAGEGRCEEDALGRCPARLSGEGYCRVGQEPRGSSSGLLQGDDWRKLQQISTSTFLWLY